MISFRNLVLGVAVTTASTAAVAQGFTQRGPTGDNRAATGNPAVQAAPNQDPHQIAAQKRPLPPGATKAPDPSGQRQSSHNANDAPAQPGTDHTGAQEQ